METENETRVRCLKCGWTGYPSGLKPSKSLKSLKHGEDVLCVCPKCGFPGVEKLTEVSDLSGLSEG